MRLIFSILILVLFFPIILRSQISGRVLDTLLNPLPGATIAIHKISDSSIVKYDITKQDGHFIVDSVSPGAYFIIVSLNGYSSFLSPAFSVNKNMHHTGMILLKPLVQGLQEVIVRANKLQIQQKPQGLILQVENSVITKGSSILQVLERSPGVLINPRDNGISLNGKSGVLVMLDGKQLRIPEDQLLIMLSGMSADNIASIELLTNPGAKYDADGSGGIINIITKKQMKKGSYGNISATAGYGYKPKAVAGFNLSHINSKFNFWTSYTYSYNSTYSEMYITGTQTMPIFGGDAAVTFDDNTHAIANNHNAMVGAEHRLSSKTLLHLNLNYSSSSYSKTNTGNAYFTILPDSLLNFLSTNRGVNTWNNFIGSLSINQILSKNENLKVDADYLFYKNENPYAVHSSFRNISGDQVSNDNELFAPAQLGFANTGIRVLSGKADYSNQVNEKLRIETGAKATFTSSKSYSGFESLVNGNWTTNPNAINKINMQEGIGAAYFSVDANIKKKTTINAGLRYEYSDTKMKNQFNDSGIVNRALSSFFPAIFFTRKINPNAELQLSYTKRISRPAYNDLASYVGYSDPTAVYSGNPMLQPTITHNIKLGYKIESFVFSLLLSRDKNAIARYQLTESPDRKILFVSPQNISKQQFVTLQANLPFTIRNWWTMLYGFAGGLRSYEVNYTKQKFTNTYFGFSANFNWQFKIPSGFTAELSGTYNSNSYNGTTRVKGFAMINAGIKKEFGRSRGVLQLSVSDIFSDQIYNVKYGTLTEESFNIKNSVSVKTESAKFPIFRLSYSIPFGNNNAKRVEKAAAEVEQERIVK